MSRKTAEGFQDPLEDRGWQQMKILLDQEMPEKKRRVIWWPWWGVAGAAVVLLFLGYQLYNDQTGMYIINKDDLAQTEQKDDTGKKPIRDQQSGELITPTNSEANSTIVKTDEEKEPPTSMLRNPELDRGFLKSQVDNNRTVDKSVAIVSGDIKEQELTNLLLTSDPESGVISESEDVYSVSEVDNSVTTDLAKTEMMGEQNNAVRTEILQTVLDIPPFFVEHIYAIGFHTPFSTEVMAETITADKIAKWDFSFNTGITSDLNFSQAGFDIGAQLRFKPIEKMAFGTGAFLWSIRSDQTFTTYSTSNPNTLGNTRDDKDGALVAIPEMQNLDSLGQVQPGSISYVQTIKNLRYLRIPIIIQFFPESTWQPYLGINHLVLLSDGRNGLLESSANLDYATNGVGIEPFTDLVRLSNTGIILGLTYQSGRHFNFDLSYTYASKSYLNYQVTRGSFNEYHRFVRLGMGYRF